MYEVAIMDNANYNIISKQARDNCAKNKQNIYLATQGVSDFRYLSGVFIFDKSLNV